jgi:hypothetical protein
LLELRGLDALLFIAHSQAIPHPQSDQLFALTFLALVSWYGRRSLNCWSVQAEEADSRGRAAETHPAVRPATRPALMVLLARGRAEEFQGWDFQAGSPVAAPSVALA